MNCKPGDLAVILGAADSPNTDRFVTVIRRAANGETFQSVCGRRVRLVDDLPCWVVAASSPLNWKGAYAGAVFAERAIRDCQLRPIRDSDGTDEMIRIAGLPQEHAHG